MDSHILSAQWANRPDDQRFLTVSDLHDFNVQKRSISREVGIALDGMQVIPRDNGSILFAKRGEQEGAELSHWSFGQLCGRAQAPAAYLRTLPAELATIPLQWSLENAPHQDAKVLVRKNGSWTADAITSSTYGRIYDSQVTDAILKTVDLNHWKVPAASYASSDPKRATTLYGSDRDLFVCLVDDRHPIEVPGRNGEDTLFRGFIIRNSEVGAASLDIILFLYRYICDNRIIWGMQSEQRLSIRHTAGGPMRWLQQARPALTQYSESDTRETVDLVVGARQKEVGKDPEGVRAWLKARGFTREQSSAAIENAEKSDESPRSLWGIVQGLTASAHDQAYGDERFEFERKVGRLLG